MGKRNTALDIAKAIGIILMIIGHCAEIDYWPYRHFIFTFHMPLFFIISGYLYRKKDIKSSLIKDAGHLIIPYFSTCGVLLLWNIVYYIHTKDFSGIQWCLQATFWGSGSEHLCKWFSDVRGIGAIWFLPALYVCKNSYNCLSSNNINKRILYSSIIFIISTLIGRYIIFIPFSVLSGLSAIIFYAIGDYFKNISKIKWPYWIIGSMCWLVSYKYSFITLVQPRIDLYFIDVIGATTASIIVYLIATGIKKRNELSPYIAWIGRYSLYILCFHLIDLNCGLSYIINSKIELNQLIPFEMNDIIIVFYRIIIPLVLTWIFVKTKQRFILKTSSQEGI